MEQVTGRECTTRYLECSPLRAGYRSGKTLILCRVIAAATTNDCVVVIRVSLWL